MLVLSRKVGEATVLGDVVVTVVRIGPNAVRLGIEAPKDMRVGRKELLDASESVIEEEALVAASVGRQGVVRSAGNDASLFSVASDASPQSLLGSNSGPHAELRTLLAERHQQEIQDSTDQGTVIETTQNAVEEGSASPDEPESEVSDRRLWSRIASELRAMRENQRDVFAAVPEEILNRYLSNEATESEEAQVQAAVANDPELREALDAIQWALNESTTSAGEIGEIPDAPHPMFLAPAQLEPEATDDPPAAWQRVKAELQACRTSQEKSWGKIDEHVVARYLADECSDEERHAVKAEMERQPELREAVMQVRGLVDEHVVDSSNDSYRPQQANIPDQSETPQLTLVGTGRRSRISRFMRSGWMQGVVIATAASLLLAINLVEMGRLSQARTELAEIKDKQERDFESRELRWLEQSRVDQIHVVKPMREAQEEYASTTTGPDGTRVVMRWVAEEGIDEATGEKKIVRKPVYETVAVNQIPSLSIRGQIPKEVLEVGSGCYPPYGTGPVNQTTSRFPTTSSNALAPIPEIRFFARTTPAHWMQSEPSVAKYEKPVQPPRGMREDVPRPRAPQQTFLQPSTPTFVPSTQQPSPLTSTPYEEPVTVPNQIVQPFTQPVSPFMTVPDDVFPTPPLEELIAKLERPSSPLQTRAVADALQAASCGNKFSFDKLTKRLLDWDEFGEAAAAYVLTRNLLASIGNPEPATDHEIEEGLKSEDQFLKWAALFSLNIRRTTPQYDAPQYVPQGGTTRRDSDSHYVSVPQRRSARNSDDSSKPQSEHLVSINFVDGMREEVPSPRSPQQTFSQPSNPTFVSHTQQSSPTISTPYEEPLQIPPAEFERRILMRVNELLASPESSLARRAAVYLVGDYGHSAWGCEANLVKILSHSKSGDERRWAAFALGQIVAQTDSTKEQLLKSLDDDDSKVRPAAAMALTSILKDNLEHKAVDQARRKLKNMLTSSDPATQRWAAYSLLVLSGKKTENPKSSERKTEKPEIEPQPKKVEEPPMTEPGKPDADPRTQNIARRSRTET